MGPQAGRATRSGDSQRLETFDAVPGGMADPGLEKGISWMVALGIVTSSVPRWDQPARDWDQRRSASPSVTRTPGSVTLGTVKVTPGSALGSHLEGFSGTAWRRGTIPPS